MNFHFLSEVDVGKKSFQEFQLSALSRTNFNAKKPAAPIRFWVQNLILSLKELSKQNAVEAFSSFCKTFPLAALLPFKGGQKAAMLLLLLAPHYLIAHQKFNF